eukprot:8398386-Lingulodinium_polyedra.AAC.1
MLARAAWAAHAPRRGQNAWAGPVDGAQTAQRGELTAALAACRLATQPLILVADSRFARDGVLKLAGGADPSDWKHGDLRLQ